MAKMTSSQSENPFVGMKIKDWGDLEKLEGRAVCPKCNKSRKYFCYTCYIPIPELENHVPKVKLPIKVDIIKHANEIDGKSTAAHAAVISPQDVSIYTYPCIPDYASEENVVLVFPGKNALSIQEYIDNFSKASKHDKEDECSEPLSKKANLSLAIPISRAVFIDSTWNQSGGIYKDQRLRDIPCVVIQSRMSQFWRHQHGSPRWFLATIEAVHQFLVELHIVCKLGINENLLTGEPQKMCELEGKGVTILDLNQQQQRNTSKSTVEEANIRTRKTILSEASPESVVPLDRNNSDHKPPKICSLPDKQPSKFVKNLALCRGIRSDPGSDPEINLCGPEQWRGKYGGDYDNLLFFFQFMYHKIHSIYDHDKLRSYQRDMI